MVQEVEASAAFQGATGAFSAPLRGKTLILRGEIRLRLARGRLLTPRHALSLKRCQAPGTSGRGVESRTYHRRQALQERGGGGI